MQLVGIAMLWLPSLAIATPLIDVADYPPRASLILCGLAFGPSGVWLFWRSHADLGRNWSPVLELRDGHRLVTGGVYARLRHPMYAAILLLTCVQAALVSNWIAGPAGACAVLILLACRLDEEEAMMASRFGEDWHAYVARTGALFPIPGKGAPDA